MKQLTFSRRQILRTIRTTCLALFFAACAGRAGADPSSSPEFNISGSNVTVLSTANNPTTAFFTDPSPNAYAITIQQGATIGNTGGNLLTFNNGTVTTAGTLTASNYAIWIQNAGAPSSTVTNTGSISATFSAVYITGNSTVNNIGGSIVTTSGAGLYLDGNATVNNTGVGTIQGSTSAVYIKGNGIVNNQGTISSQADSAVFIIGTGSVTNSGTITSQDKSAIAIDGVGSVTNSGTLTGSHSGVYINNNGTVTNSGTITGQNWSGIDLFDLRSSAGSGSVTNSGTIIGNTNNTGVIYTQSGVYFFGTALLNNSSTGNISGFYGVASEGGTVNNSGTITGTQAGVYFYTGTNTSTGPEVLSNPGTINNTGTISGYYGVKIVGTGTVNNSASITGDSTKGVGVLLNSGTVNNGRTGTISGYYGVYVIDKGTVNNAGTITGTNGGYGVQVNTGTVNNSGTISGYNGVRITGTGTLRNNAAGTISGYSAVAVEGTGGSVVNLGTISGTYAGVLITGDNSSLLTRGGEISGGSDSILLAGANNSVTVTGRTNIVGTMSGYNVANDNTLRLNVVGMTPAQAAAANALNGQSSGTIVAGLGASQYTYNWADFAGVTVHAISLEQAVDSGLTAIATKIDDTQLPRGFDEFYAQASANPEAAINSLVGRELNNAVGTINLNNATALDEIFDSRALDLRSGAGGFDLSSLSVTSSSLIASLGQTDGMLGRMMGNALLSGAAISDSKDEGQTADSTRWGAWAAGTVTLADQSNTSNSPGYNATTGSPTIGIDFKVSHNLALGVLANYSTTGANFSDGSSMGVQTGLGALYGVWADGPWYVNALAGAGYTTYDNQRTVPMGNPGTAHSSPDGNQVMANVTGGRDFKMGKMVISPEVGVLYTHVTENSYSETGEGIYDLSQAQQNIDSLRTKVGFHVTENIDWEGLKFTPQVHAAWYHECLDDSRGVSTSLAGAPALGSFVVQTNAEGRDFAILGLGLAASPTRHDNVTFFLNYDIQVGQDDYIANTINGGIRYDF